MTQIHRAQRLAAHRQEMAERRERQLARKPTVAVYVSTSIATGNRHGGQHLNAREIARRSRQFASPPPS